MRTPMQWDGGWNAGFLSADPESLYSPLILDPVYGVSGSEQFIRKSDPGLVLLDEVHHRNAEVHAGFW